MLFCNGLKERERKKKEHSVRWLGRWSNIGELGDEIKMIKIHCMKLSKILQRNYKNGN